MGVLRQDFYSLDFWANLVQISDWEHDPEVRSAGLPGLRAAGAELCAQSGVADRCLDFWLSLKKLWKDCQLGEWSEWSSPLCEVTWPAREKYVYKTSLQLDIDSLHCPKNFVTFFCMNICIRAFVLVIVKSYKRTTSVANPARGLELKMKLCHFQEEFLWNMILSFCCSVHAKDPKEHEALRS